MNTLTPTVDATPDALDGPGTVCEVGDRTHLRRSHQAVAEPGALASGVGDDSPASGEPTRWRLADNRSTNGSGQPVTATADQPDSGHDGDAGGEKQEPPKRCRGCQAQMSATCPGCWRKTPSYCGTCRRDQADARSREPQLLASGLPRLRPGGLPQLVAQVMRDNPLPHHLRVAGWTASRVAVYLPGRSTSAISNALGKLTRTGTAQLIGEHPARYQLTPPETADRTHD